MRTEKLNLLYEFYAYLVGVRMTSAETIAVITAIGTSIIAPIMAHRASNDKIEAVKADRRETANKRDTDLQLLKAEVSRIKERICKIEEMSTDIGEIKNSVSKIEAVLPFLIEHLKRGDK